MRRVAYHYFLVLFLGVGPGAFCGAQNASETESLRDLLEKWVQTKQLISRERQRAREQKEILEQRIDLMKNQVTGVREKIEETRARIGDAEEKQAELNARKAKEEESLTALKEEIGPLESRTAALLSRLPEPVQDKVRALSQQIPEESGSTKLPLSTRYQNVIGVLNAVNNFNNEVTVTTEVRDFGSGESLEVKVLYFGLGQAYFCNRDGTVGGVGRPGPSGWRWERRDEIAADVASAIARYHNDKPAAYEALPVTIGSVDEANDAG